MNFKFDLTVPIIGEIHNRLIDYDNFINGNIIVIENRLDWKAKDKLTYREWVETKNTFPTIKLEGFENCSLIKQFVEPILYDHMTNVHVFISNADGKSFDMHRDTVNVWLCVLQGEKTVEMPTNLQVLKEGNGLCIPKGHYHEVYSTHGTIALSIGFE